MGRAEGSDSGRTRAVRGGAEFNNGCCVYILSDGVRVDCV